ncbi:hypothetical protein [Roseibium salinum]|uniref:ThuA-like domain-containing protein n=1 Tax=Roseibium salinum TaxID=1604349 RepID=A0ABT3R304_9HYPH|nr:hypothetical protein [Roseibium sp. DSM 29163]MCX2723636.1 hypothetical protein [Roseibium sp. DSM 29163]MDN3718495.1 hypothetical protein [Roseibium salinum]
MRIVAPTSGTYYHIEALEGPRHAAFFDMVTSPEELFGVLTPGDCLFVPCRTPAHRMIAQKEVVAAHLDAGGTVVATGESHSDLWLPAIRFHPVPTNWWWWLEPGADLGNRLVSPDHPLLHEMTSDHVTWHLHGWFDVPDGATVLTEDAEGRAIFYEDRVSTPGRMIITSLDPQYHHGSHFMPASTRFLDRFLPNLKAYLDG